MQKIGEYYTNKIYHKIHYNLPQMLVVSCYAEANF